MASWQIFEDILDTALTTNNYEILNKRDFNFINQFTGGKHIPDKIIRYNNEIIILSKKWQETSGTADEKTPYEIIKLLDLKEHYPIINRCYILLGGVEFTKAKGRYYLSGDWNKFLSNEYKNTIKIVNIDTIIPLISRNLL